jgi:hypothetical protein
LFDSFAERKTIAKLIHAIEVIALVISKTTKVSAQKQNNKSRFDFKTDETVLFIFGSS